MNIKVFQIYYQQQQLNTLDPTFLPYDNTSNPNPALREWYIMEDLYTQQHDLQADYWGAVSWRFQEKTGITGKEFVDFVKANPGYDVYFVNPAIINEAVFANSWEQGDIHHPNISSIANTFLTKIGYTDVDVKSIVMDRTYAMYSNYFVASCEFWDRYVKFVRKIFTCAEEDAEFKHQVFAAGLSNYSRDANLSNFSFLVERLTSTFIEMENIKVLGYIPKEPQNKYKPYIRTVSALSDLKILINQYESDELYAIWDHFRRDFLEKNPGVLNLE